MIGYRKVDDFKYDIRFKYFGYFRMTRLWWKPFEYFGERLKQLVYKLHHKFGKRTVLSEKENEQAKKLSFNNPITGYEEYVDRFTSINPYCQKGWSEILWFIRKHLTFD